MLLRSLFVRECVNFLSHIDYRTSFFRKISAVDLEKHIRKLKMDNSLKSREDPVVLKLTSPEFKSIFTQELKDLKSLFDKYGFEIRIAGGAVRDLLSGKKPVDVDFATTATPEQMKEIFIKENVRMVNMNGEKHGTITPRINDKDNFEVTTLRIDVVTDGRHAEVCFTTDWKLDANRRDLTINSMFLGFDGSVYDYFYGYEDILAKRVAFVGNPDTRIKEDYLRILRYFRFYGRIAEKPDSHEDTTLQIISQNVSNLTRISGERIWNELKKILSGNFAGDILKTMLHCGCGKYMGLPESPNIKELDKVWEIAKGLDVKLHPMALLASLFNNVEEVTALNERLKFSVYDRELAYFIVEHREDKPSPKPLLPYQLLLLNTKMKHRDTKEYIIEVLKYRNEISLAKQFMEWEIPYFPISGGTLSKAGITEKKLFGNIMYKLKDHWAHHDFKASEEDLLPLVPSIVEELKAAGGVKIDHRSKKPRT